DEIFSKGMVIEKISSFNDSECSNIFSLAQGNINTNSTCQFVSDQCYSLGEIMMLKIEKDRLNCQPSSPGEETNLYDLGMSFWIIGLFCASFIYAYYLTGCMHFVNLKYPDDY